MEECKICKTSLKDAKNNAKRSYRDSEQIEYCSKKCFMVYLDSDEFDGKLCEILNIKYEKGNNL